jgi:hypothetical protein
VPKLSEEDLSQMREINEKMATHRGMTLASIKNV